MSVEMILMVVMSVIGVWFMARAQVAFDEIEAELKGVVRVQRVTLMVGITSGKVVHHLNTKTPIVRFYDEEAREVKTGKRVFWRATGEDEIYVERRDAAKRLTVVVMG